MRHLTLLCLVATLAPHAFADEPATPPGPELKDGDVVAMIGNTFIEREGQYGYIETALTARYADRDIKFRNLGWSGDTVWCESRAYFGTPEDGFKHLMEHVDLVKPTVIILNYGGNEAFAGEAGLEKFIKGYERLLDELEKRTKRIVLMSPIPLGEIAKPNTALYGSAIESLANRRGYHFIDLIKFVVRGTAGGSVESDIDRVHLSPIGYLRVARHIRQEFRGGFAQPFGGFSMSWGDPIAKQLRDIINQKNELFFHRHRPQNETYLRGFRKHEQGNNAVEIPQFEPLIEAKEKEIAEIRKELLEALQAKEGDK